MTRKLSSPLVSFTITVQDYINALRLRARRHWIRNLALKLVSAAALAAVLLAMVLSGFRPSLTIGAIGGLIALACLFLFTYLVRLPWQARKVYSQQKTMQHPVTASWNSEGYSASTKAASGTISWSDFWGWTADENIILFFHSPVLFQMLPRRALTPEEADDLFVHLAQSGLHRL